MNQEHLKVGEKIYYIKNDTKPSDKEPYYLFGTAPIVAIQSNDNIYFEKHLKFPLKDVDFVTVHVDEDENGERDYTLTLQPYEYYLKFEDYVYNLVKLTAVEEKEKTNG